MTQLAIFDLDNTLIGGDSDHLWGEFLVKQGIVDADFYQAENERYYQAYVDGSLDIHEFLAFALKPLAEHDREALCKWRSAFVEECIQPIRLPLAESCIQAHRDAGDQLVIVTATNSFVTAPIAAMLGIEHLVATEPEQRDGQYTGAVIGTPCFREGKIERLAAWAAEQGVQPWSGCFYSDSHNDIPLLSRVARPIAVNPDEKLARHARAQGWTIEDFRS